MTAGEREFIQEIKKRFYIAIHQSVEDNFNSDRFNYDGIDRSQEFLLEGHCYFLEWFFLNTAGLYGAYSTLVDTESREIYKDLILFRLAGHLHYKVRNSIERNLKASKELVEKMLDNAAPSGLQAEGMFGRLVRYDLEWEGQSYKIDCMRGGLLHSLAYRQYFYCRDGIDIGPESGDHIIDGGACLGETTAIFSNIAGSQGHVYAFDPVHENLAVLRKNVEGFSKNNVSIFPFGLSDTNVDADPIRLSTYNAGFSVDDSGIDAGAIPLRSIDHLVKSGKIRKIDFIKFDIEGSELAALAGAVNSIEKFRPRMAISIYHKPLDYFQIIDFIDKNFTFYDLHLDHHSIHREETVVYCRPRN